MASLSLAASLLAGAVGATAGEFLVGGDISWLSRIEELGGVYRDHGTAQDAIAIFRANGSNCFRLRLFVDPNMKDGVINDLPYTIALARRIKASGAALLLDFHYSDTWADPGKQGKPAAWQELDFDALEKQVEAYTAATIAEFREKGALPDIVQVGNEINPGMLWPDGKLCGKGAEAELQWDQLARLLKAGVRGVRKPLTGNEKIRIMVHIANGGSWAKTKWFFDHLTARQVPFDIIGQSYYPWWHGTLAGVRENLENMAQTYNKDIIVVETAYPYRGETWWSKKDNMAWPITPAGQEAFLVELRQAIAATPGQHGIGMLYWAPESIPVRGLSAWNGGATAVFDSDGAALPGIRALSKLK